MIEKEVNNKRLNMYDVIDQILKYNTEIQIRLLKVLANELKLTNIQLAKKILKLSYNGVKDHRKTTKISKTTFAILKEDL